MHRFIVGFVFVVTGFGSILISILSIHYKVIDSQYGTNMVAGLLMQGIVFSMAVEASLAKRAMDANIVASLTGLSIAYFCLFALSPNPIFMWLMVLPATLIVLLNLMVGKYRERREKRRAES